MWYEIGHFVVVLEFAKTPAVLTGTLSFPHCFDGPPCDKPSAHTCVYAIIGFPLFYIREFQISEPL